MRLNKLAALCLVSVALGCAGLPAAAADTGDDGPQAAVVQAGTPSTWPPSWNAKSWMGDLYGSGTARYASPRSSIPAEDTKLGDLAIPGSHDSGAYFTRHGARECGFNDAMLFAPETTRRWARTQHYDLYTQAELGVRSFDIRPYWNGSEIRTCHTLDTASFDDVFTNLVPGHTGLNKFATDNPEEVMIINLSHFRAGDNNGTPRYNRGIDALADFLRTNVCPRAINPDLATVDGRPGEVTLKQMWANKKNYVVLADNLYDLHTSLMKRSGMKECVFQGEGNVSGGYAGEKGAVEYAPGKRSSTNLWFGLLDESDCKYSPISCKWGFFGDESAETVRLATEKVLLDGITGNRSSLHESSYIWVYGEGWRFKVGEVALGRVIAELPDASLILATENTTTPVWWALFTQKGDVRSGLQPYARDFIERLEKAARSRGDTGVNIVNMDAIGNTPATREQFIGPLMAINLSHLLPAFGPPAAEAPDQVAPDQEAPPLEAPLTTPGAPVPAPEAEAPLVPAGPAGAAKAAPVSASPSFAG